MKTSCAPACASCDLLKFENRCPFPEGLEETAAFKPGDMGRIFSDIKAGVWDVYKVRVRRDCARRRRDKFHARPCC